MAAPDANAGRLRTTAGLGVGLDDVGAPCIAYQRMAQRWCLIDDLLGGTLAMRLARERWLPKERDEKVAEYDARLGRSVLYEALDDTIEEHSSKPFSRAVTVQGDAPPSVTAMLSDVTRSGQNLTQFLAEVFKEAVTYGHTGAIVDFPPDTRPADPATGAKPPPTLADEADKRAYFVHVKPKDILGWRVVEGANGGWELDMLRFREVRTEQVGEYGEQEVEYVRVYTRTDWKLYKRGGRGDWAEVDGGPNTLGKVPFVAYYVRRAGYLESRPPFEKLAWKNLEHWQKSSQQNNILHFARVPMLFMSGVSQQERDNPTSLGANRVFKTVNPDADAKWVEHTGKAIEAGQADLDRVEQQMEVLGLKPSLERAQGSKTATGRAFDEQSDTSTVQAWIRDLETAAAQMFKLAAQWSGDELKTEADDAGDTSTGEGGNAGAADGDPAEGTGEAFGVNIFNEFTITLRGSEDMDTLLKMQAVGAADKRTLAVEAKRRGVLSPTTDIDAVLEQADTEAPPMPPAMGPDGLDGPPGQDPNADPTQKPPGGGKAGGPAGGPPGPPKARAGGQK